MWRWGRVFLSCVSVAVAVAVAGTVDVNVAVAVAVAVVIMFSFLLFSRALPSVGVALRCVVSVNVGFYGVGRRLPCGSGLEVYWCSRPDNPNGHFSMVATCHIPPFSLDF